MTRGKPTYPIDDRWRRRVKRALDQLGWEQADLATAAGCSSSVVTELLNGKKHASSYVPKIHVVLGWTPPTISLSDEAEELMSLWENMDDINRGRLLERARLLADSSTKKK